MTSSNERSAPGDGVRTRLARCVDAIIGGGERRFLWKSLALGLLIHGTFTVLAIVLHWTHLRIDEVNVAQRLAGGMGYCFNYYRLFGEEYGESAFFPPAYVYNVVWMFKLFGVRLTLPIQNLVFTLAISFALYAFGKRVFGDRTARIALIASLVYPPFFTRIGHGSPVYFKMLFMVLMVAAMQRVWTRVAGARTQPVRGIWPEVAAGILAGVLALSMPDALAYVLLFAAALVLVHRFHPSSLRAALVVGVTTAFVIAPWTIRNYETFNRFCLVSSNGGFNFYMGNCPGSLGEVNYELITELDERLDGELARTDEFGRDKILYREGMAHIRAHPFDSFVALLEKSALHWFFRPENVNALTSVSDEDSEFDASFQVYIWTYALAYVPLLVLAAMGLWISRGRLLDLSPLWLTFFYSTAIAALFVVQTKMRLIKVEPFLLLFAAHAIAVHLPSARRRRSANDATDC